MQSIFGELPIFQKAMALIDELTSGPSLQEMDDGFLAAETRMVTGAKKVALMCLGSAVQKFAEKLADEQEILAHFADIAMDTYALESAVLRAKKRAADQGEERPRLQEAAVRCFAQDAMDRIEASGRKLLAAVEEGDMLRTYLAGLKRFTKREAQNTVALRRQVAEAAIDRTAYPLMRILGERYRHVVHPAAGHISYVFSTELWDPQRRGGLQPNPADLLAELTAPTPVDDN